MQKEIYIKAAVIELDSLEFVWQWPRCQTNTLLDESTHCNLNDLRTLVSLPVSHTATWPWHSPSDTCLSSTAWTYPTATSAHRLFTGRILESYARACLYSMQQPMMHMSPQFATKEVTDTV